MPNPSSDAFRCAVESREDYHLVRPVGELDLATVAQVEAALASLEEPRRVVIDLRGLTFIDSSGIHLLVRWQAHATAANFALEMIDGPACVTRTLDLTGVRQLLGCRHARESDPLPA